MDTYEEFKDVRDGFEILSIHNGDANSLEHMDEVLNERNIPSQFWSDRKPEFPTLLDGNNALRESFSVAWYATVLIINPEGKLVRGTGSSAQAFPAFKAELEKLREAKSGGADGDSGDDAKPDEESRPPRPGRDGGDF